MYYHTIAFPWLIIGTISIALGAGVLAWDWKLGIRRTILVFVGAVLVSIGGLLTTLGWDELGDYRSKQNLIKSVAKEWKINTSILLMYKGAKTSPRVTYSVSWEFPQLKTAALYSVMISGLFDGSRQKDESFLNAISDYVTRVDAFNLKILSFDNDFEHQNSKGIQREAFLRSYTFRSVVKKHEELKTILKENYPEVLTEKFVSNDPCDSY